MSAMTTMSAAFCVKAPVAAKASAKVRVLAARLTPRCRAARRRHRNFFRSRKRRRNAGPDPSLTPHPPFRPQVAYGAPVKAFKASAFSVKAARRTGVVAMSAATDDIIEKMKGLTVRARARSTFPGRPPSALSAKSARFSPRFLVGSAASASRARRSSASAPSREDAENHLRRLARRRARDASRSSRRRRRRVAPVPRGAASGNPSRGVPSLFRFIERPPT
jgi:DNA-directed RNA polymerase specialized sigma24 family protein